jgi:hypothetical protein
MLLKLSPSKFKSHGGICQNCGREILPRRLRGKIVGRARLFCSNKCRQAAFRNADFDRRHQVSEALRNAEKTPIAPTACRTDFAGRASPVVLRKIRQTEQPWRDAGAPIVSSDGVVCFVVGKLRRSR